jgi:anti-sigma factor RsiW
LNVTHSSFEAQVDAYLDGELAVGDASELETHLAQCPECTRFRDQRLELRAAIVAGVPTFQAPAALRERVRAAAREAGASPGPRAPRRLTVRNLWRPLALAASLAVVAVGSWTFALQRAAGEALADDVLSSHIRSLMPGHLSDVPSSDQHTVKPWFNGRLDFSPPVYDFAGGGYPLIGGRLDYVDGRPVAALVYGRRQHVINVFVWPAARGPSGGRRARDRQGYHMLHWTTSAWQSSRSSRSCCGKRTRRLGTGFAERRLLGPFRDHQASCNNDEVRRQVKEAPATSQTADCECLKRPPQALAPCPRATPGLQLATRPASGRVALVPTRCAVTHVSVVQESILLRLLGDGMHLQGTQTPSPWGVASVEEAHVTNICDANRHSGFGIDGRQARNDLRAGRT